MKQALLWLLLVFSTISNSFALTPKSEYIIWETDLSCYTMVATPSWEDWKYIHLETSDPRNILALQDDTILPITLKTSSKFIPFTTNIPQSEKTQTSPTDYANLYDFGDLDSEDNLEIILDFPGYNGLTSRLNFSHSAKFYTPIYSISEDGVNYSRISEKDINDFQIQKMKITFRSKNDENIREIIKIQELNIERLQDIVEISPISNTSLKLYYRSTCSELNKEEELPTSRQPIWEWVEVLSIDVFWENPLYKLRTRDSDQDGIKDLYDNCVDISNKDQLDINQNSVWDACEFDSDKDGIPDEIDNCRAISNPDQKDDDNDNIGNLCDNCNLYNPPQLDTNNNGVWDTCDQAKNYLEQNDDDWDNIINSQDNCRGVANTNQVDSDNDGVGDACDNCKAFQNTDQADLNENGIWDICEDSDSDGVDTLKDNCPNIPNPDQADSDNDGIGNLCEDDDGDSIIFQNDNCPYKYNRDQRDTDGDTIGDVCDEKDNRFLESNKTVFVVLMILVTLLFLWGIFIVARKIQK